MITEMKPGQVFVPGSKPRVKEVMRDAHGVAVFSDDREYRTRLIRQWDHSLPGVLFFMLNPSTADAFKLDPTVRRCLGFAHRWGYGGFEVRNLFSLRSTDPRKMKRHPDPIGPMDILYDSDKFPFVVAAWGDHGKFMNRGIAVERAMAEAGYVVHHLGLTKKGYPRHPLYIATDTAPQVLDPDRKIERERKKREKGS